MKDPDKYLLLGISMSVITAWFIGVGVFAAFEMPVDVRKVFGVLYGISLCGWLFLTGYLYSESKG